MKTKVCSLVLFARNTKEFANEENAVTKGSTVWHVNVVNRHERDDKHKQCIQKYLSELFPKHKPDLDKSVAIAKKKLSTEKEKQMKALFNTAYYIAKEGDSFRKYSSLCQLQAKNDANIGEHYLSDVACRQLHEDVCSGVANARFMPVLCDGSTDAYVREQEAVHDGYPNLSILKIPLDLMLKK